MRKRAKLPEAVFPCSKHVSGVCSVHLTIALDRNMSDCMASKSVALCVGEAMSNAY